MHLIGHDMNAKVCRGHWVKPGDRLMGGGQGGRVLEQLHMEVREGGCWNIIVLHMM